jgi:ribosomal protein S18 acetylase RimI-like enzyme
VSRSVEIRSADASDTAWLEQIMDEEWGGPFQVANGESYRPTDLPCVIAELDGERVGYAALRVVGDVAWIGVIGSLRARQGVGSALVAALADDARSRGCSVLRAITTNENGHAQDFYRALGFRLIEIRPGEVNESRRLKPSIPLEDEAGTPITDELEYELTL